MHFKHETKGKSRQTGVCRTLKIIKEASHIVAQVCYLTLDKIFFVSWSRGAAGIVRRMVYYPLVLTIKFSTGQASDFPIYLSSYLWRKKRIFFLYARSQKHLHWEIFISALRDSFPTFSPLFEQTFVSSGLPNSKGLEMCLLCLLACWLIFCVCTYVLPKKKKKQEMLSYFWEANWVEHLVSCLPPNKLDFLLFHPRAATSSRIIKFVCICIRGHLLFFCRRNASGSAPLFHSLHFVCGV